MFSEMSYVWLGDYSVSIKEGKHCSTPGGEYVELEHGTQYSVTVQNNIFIKCELEMSIDGHHMGKTFSYV